MGGGVCLSDGRRSRRRCAGANYLTEALTFDERIAGPDQMEIIENCPASCGLPISVGGRTWPQSQMRFGIVRQNSCAAGLSVIARKTGVNLRDPRGRNEKRLGYIAVGDTQTPKPGRVSFAEP